MSETNQDSTSKAPNMQIQTLMPAPLPNPKVEKPEKFDGTLNSRGGNRRCSST